MKPHTLHPLPSHSTVLLIDSSTIEMALVKQVAAKATDVGANFLYAPVSGGAVDLSTSFIIIRIVGTMWE